MLAVKPGMRLKSQVCDAELMVVKGAGDLDLRCGGLPLVAADAGAGAGAEGDPELMQGTLMGKRYTDAGAAIELLCTKPGQGSLSLGDEVLQFKQAQALPSSD